jgi:hypothetical protein
MSNASEQLINVAMAKLAKVEAIGELDQLDANEFLLAVNRFMIQGTPSTLDAANFNVIGTSPAGSVPLTLESIQQAVARASEAEDAKAKRNAQIAGAVASLAIAGIVTAATGGVFSPALVGQIVKTAAPLLEV